MTEPNETKKPRALADLARALEAAGWTIAELINDGIAVTKTDDDRYVRFQVSPTEITLTGWNDEFPVVTMAPDVWKALDTIRAWQAPPSPDAGAFEQLIDDVIEDAKYVQERMYSGEVSRSESIRYLANSKAALLAFAPGVRITEEPNA